MFYHLFSPSEEIFRVLGANRYLENFPRQIHEEADAWKIEMAVPGIKREQLEISVEQGQNTFLTVKANDGEQLLQRFHLHKGLNIEEIEAQLEDGILQIRIAKKEMVKKLVAIA